jgi:hypothetical protein
MDAFMSRACVHQQILLIIETAAVSETFWYTHSCKEVLNMEIIYHLVTNLWIQKGFATSSKFSINSIMAGGKLFERKNYR